ncbi:YdgA family protein [Pseudomonas sp. LRF_L74]|uniref:YdgA family protein n=1 Tax=Pseudomonas sp. LRF_L74 TaxID=3369422 RepID=UPI003F619FFD
MKKTAIAAGIVIAIGAAAVGGAWYTGNQLEGVLRTAVQDSNEQMRKAMLGVNGSATAELLSLEKHFFSSTARYRVTFTSPEIKDGEKLEVLFVDEIEHGPFPLSRVKALKLMPVMAASNFALEKNGLTEKWFEAAKGESPLRGQTVLSYDLSSSGSVRLLPLDLVLDETSSLKFSGLDMDINASAKAARFDLSGKMDSLVLDGKERGEPVHLALNGLTFDSQREKGASDFYLGTSNAKLTTAEFKFGEQARVLLNDLSQADNLSESGGTLKGKVTYDVGQISYNGQKLGSSQMIWGIDKLDVAGLQALVAFYERNLEALAKTSETGELPPLSDADKAELKVAIDKLLDAKPRIALERLAFKTANGESTFNLSLDLAKPESFELPADEIARQLVSQVDARLLVSKAMIGDVVGLQAQLSGEVVDQAAIAQQASMMSDMASDMAVASQMARLDGSNIVSDLHYSDGQVDLNGQKMPVEQFAQMVMAMGGSALGGGAAADDESQGDDEAYDYDDAPDAAE